MLKLMKYEFKKQAFSKYIILSVVILLEILFLVGVALDRHGFIATSMSLLWMVAIAAVIYLAIESLDTYSKDMKLKSSYMLFLTPTTSYSIVGAKVLTTAIQGVLGVLSFLAIFLIDGGILVARYDMFSNVMEVIRDFIQQFLQLNIDKSFFFSLAVLIITAWLSVITLGFFSITLSTTFLANSKLKGFISFAIFIAINSLYNYITMNSVGYSVNTIQEATKLLAINSIYNVVFIVITYFSTAWMIDKKISV